MKKNYISIFSFLFVTMAFMSCKNDFANNYEYLQPATAIGIPSYGPGCGSSSISSLDPTFDTPVIFTNPDVELVEVFNDQELLASSAVGSDSIFISVPIDQYGFDSNNSWGAIKFVASGKNNLYVTKEFWLEAYNGVPVWFDNDLVAGSATDITTVEYETYTEYYTGAITVTVSTRVDVYTGDDADGNPLFTEGTEVEIPGMDAAGSIELNGGTMSAGDRVVVTVTATAGAKTQTESVEVYAY